MIISRISRNVLILMGFYIFPSYVLNASEWLKSNEMTTIYEALVKISSESIYSSSKQMLPRDILKNYIYNMDPYGDYFTKQEYEAFESTLSAEYAGIGMILYQQKRDDKILCIPMNKKLYRQGISKYDELLSVNGRLVKGKNFYLVSSWIRGIKNSSVRIKVRKSSGKLKLFTFKRTEQNFKSIQRVIDDNIAMIRIIRFTSETPNELQTILRDWSKDIPIIIDLRGNGGGDFFAAIQSADLLLPRRTLIASIETRKKYIDYHASRPDITKGHKIILLQDKFTASAAEVFIGALTQNKRAQSLGEKSFGKGVAQKFIALSNGDALLLTYGTILIPNKKPYHKKGLSSTSRSTLKVLSQYK